MAKNIAIGTEITLDDTKAKAKLYNFETAVKKASGANTLGGIASSASKEWGSLDAIMDKATGTIGSIPISATAAAGALAAIGAAAIGLGKELFNLVKEGSDLGRTFGAFEAKTGLSATAVSTLADAAHLSGKELSDLQRPLVYFNELLVKAQSGSEKASASLAKMGVTDLKNLEGALDQASKGFNNSAAGQQKLHAAVEEFGKRGGPDFISVLAKMQGGFKEAQIEAERMGLTLSEDDVKAAKDFGRQWDTLSYQIKIGTAKFALTYAPMITGAINDIGHTLASNKDEWAVWGKWITKEVKLAFLDIKKEMNDLATLGEILGTLNPFSNDTWDTLGDRLAKRGAVGSRIDADIIEANNPTQSGFTSARRGFMGMPAASSYAIAHKSIASSDPLAAWLANHPEIDSEAGTTKGPKSAKDIFKLSSAGKAIVDAAEKLGVSPLDLATIISFESAGTYSPSVKGGAGGKYKGLIQFGPEEQAKYGVKPGQSFESQVTTSVVAYLKDRFASVGRSTAGASLLDLYRTVLGGNPNASLTGKDAFGTSPLSGVQKMLKENRPDALKRFFGGSESNAKGGEWGKAFASVAEETAAQAKKDSQDELDLAQKALDDWIAAEKKASDNRGEIKRGEANYAEEVLKGQLDQGLIDETEYAKRVGKIHLDLLVDERDALGDQISSAENLHKLEILDLAIAKQKVANANELLGIEKDLTKEYEKQVQDAYGAKKANSRGYSMKTRELGKSGSSLADGIFGALGKEQFKTEAEMYSSTMQRLGDIGGQAFNSLAGAMGSLVEQWVLYGNTSEGAAKKAIATSLAMAASQSAVSAIMETAYGIAALTPWGAAIYGPAVLHFKSAALFAGIALGTGLLGRAVAGDSFNQQGSASGGSNGSAATNSAPVNNTPYSRASSNAYYSGRNDSNNRLATAIENFNRKVDSAKPGDVFMKGMRQNPGAIGAQNARDAQTHPDGARQFLSSAGFNRRG